MVWGPKFVMFGGVFRIPAALLAKGNDLTGGLALPMFPAAASRPDRPRTAEKANKSLGYYESGHSGIARQGEDDQQVSRARLRGLGLVRACARPAGQERFGRSRRRFPHDLGGGCQSAEAPQRH